MVWWYGPCAAWGCCASMSCKEQSTSIYELSELVSSGSGPDGHQVYRATQRDTGDVVALKVLPRSFLTDKTQRRHMRREIHVLMKLHHPNLVRLFDVYESTNTVEIAFELAQGGQVLRRVLEPHASVFELSEAELSRAFADVIQGLMSLHVRGWIHGDVRPEHMLFSEVDASSKALLVDFGRAGPPSTFLESLREQPILDGRFLPPWLRGQSPTTRPIELATFKHAVQVDMWALGMCLYVMLFAKFPFQEGDHDTLTFPVEFAHVSRAAKDLLARLLTHDPKAWLTYVSSKGRRISQLECRADEAANHPWLRQPSVAPRGRWNPYILAVHEQFVHDYCKDGVGTTHSSSSPDENTQRPSWISTDGALVLDCHHVQSADAYIHQADMDLGDTWRVSEEKPLSQEEAAAAAKSERGWRLMWKGLGIQKSPAKPGVYSPLQSP
ncbi:Aste57867_10781 [Aphanomyces stellatus]|uniref:Aste57867_10781 protein n=1 Tax=Aphanomyces stellatus TaxID=120398 RepID=A0A485KRZ8_9STRA|nr:hypothetical protein As57867_010741 [Aphanomyces stellatus]VFT87651.1 Aste57867_10781 [Aphanomyces stellatus]